MTGPIDNRAPCDAEAERAREIRTLLWEAGEWEQAAGDAADLDEEDRAMRYAARARRLRREAEALRRRGDGR